MPKITVENESTFEAARNTKLVLAIEDAGIDILHRCGGYARCTTCRVEFLSGEPKKISSDERETLQEDGLLGKVRLSCQVRVDEEDMVVRVVNRASSAGIPAGQRPDA